MADDERATSRALALTRALEEAPFKFDFFQALRRLECALRDRPRWGTAARPSEEPVRLGQLASLAAAPATLASFSAGRDGRPARLAVYFFGLLGPNAPLPLHLTEYARQRLHHHNDPTLGRFLDVFHHRLLTLFYRAWASGQPSVQHDRPDSDRFVAYLGSLLGLGTPALQARDAFPDRAKLYYASLLLGHTRNADGLRAMVEDYFRMPTQLEQFVGEWVDIPNEHSWKLGAGPRRGAPALGRLGRTAIVGTRAWMRQQRFRLVLGPLRPEQFRRMLPGGEGMPRLAALVRGYAGDELKWDVRLVLAKNALRPLELGRVGQLGRTSWLVAQIGQGEVENLVVDPLQDQLRAEAANRTRPAFGQATHPEA
jgi:type VI secretion system protein ImpH